MAVKSDGLYRVVTKYLCAGFVVSDGKVVSCAPILLPPPDGVCPICATDHPWDQPHNKQSLYYQMAFKAEHGRWPTWTDAMRHCAPEVRTQWRSELVRLMRAKGVEVPADLLVEEAGGR